MKHLMGIALLLAVVAGCKKDKAKEPAGNAPPAGRPRRRRGPAGRRRRRGGRAAAAADSRDPDGKTGVQIVDLTYGGVETPGLPAIKGDGSLIAAASFADDGGRGYLDVILYTLDAKTGAVTAKTVLADPDKTSDAEQKEPSELPKVEAEAKAAVAKANELFAAGDWRKMPGSDPLQVSDAAEYTDEITLGDLLYKLDMAKQTLTISRAGKKLATHKLTKLYKVPKNNDGGEDMCGDDSPFLRAIYTDSAAAKVLVEIGFVAGGHNCGASGSVYTVVPLPQ